jgi:phosphatidate phosphatase PAH1
VAFLRSFSERSDPLAVARSLRTDNESISEQKLDATAAALEQVASVKEDYQRRIKAADPADKNRLAEEGHNALVKAVTDKGLSVEEYTSILEVAENDPAVREKILQRMHPHTK